MNTPSLESSSDLDCMSIASRPAMTSALRSKVFSEIYHYNRWRDPLSRSGRGSTPQNTPSIRAELPSLISMFGVQRFLDAGCGDFCWMNEIVLPEQVSYFGIDIVKDIIVSNNLLYENARRSFFLGDITTDLVPDSELVLCRDCLVHLPHNDIYRALANLLRGSVRYLVATTFPRLDVNIDIRVGQWRPLNLQRTPFSFPDPIRIIPEDFPARGRYSDKALAVWRAEDLDLPCIRP